MLQPEKNSGSLKESDVTKLIEDSSIPEEMEKPENRSPGLKVVAPASTLTEISFSQVHSKSCSSHSTDTPKDLSAEQIRLGLHQLSDAKGDLIKKEEYCYDIKTPKNKSWLMSSKRSEFEKESKDLELELKRSTERRRYLENELTQHSSSKEQFKIVINEYEKIISQLVAQKEEEESEIKRQRDLLIEERNSAVQHFNNTEIAFNDVLQKFEHNKSVIESYKVKEDVLKSKLAQREQILTSSNEKYECLKNHTINQLEAANKERDIMQRSHLAESTKLKATLKKLKVRIAALEDAVKQKSKVNDELAAFCDDLINKIGLDN